MQDFNYLATNAFEITLELGCEKYTPQHELKKEWDRNREALLAYLWKAHIGIKGLVTDDSGFIHNAIISVVNITGPVPRPIRHDVTTGKILHCILLTTLLSTSILYFFPVSELIFPNCCWLWSALKSTTILVN